MSLINKWWLQALAFVIVTLVFFLLTANRDSSEYSDIEEHHPALTADVNASDFENQSNAAKTIPILDYANNSSSEHTETYTIPEQSKKNLGLEIPASKPALAQPTEQQKEYQVLLEQKINGDIQVMGPLLSEIIGSQEYLSLTERQRSIVNNRIIERLNNGELRSEDVYP